jgi:hypothetical protein
LSPPPGDALRVAPLLLAPATGDMLKTRPELNDDWGGVKVHEPYAPTLLGKSALAGERDQEMRNDPASDLVLK